MARWQDLAMDYLEGVSSLFRGWFVVEMFYKKGVRAERKMLRAVRRNCPPPRKSAQPNIQRRRALTLSKSLSSEKVLRTEQPQSLILNKLPPEIRQQVWEESLGGMTFHLHIEDRKLAHAACASPEPASCDSVGGLTGCHHHLDYREKGNLLALLQTCRLVYSEAISVLYAKNKFTVVDSYCMEFLSQFLLTQRFSTITSFSFECACGDVGLPRAPTPDHPKPSLDFEYWVLSWKIIASMKGLQNLVVSGYGTINTWKELGEPQNIALLEPIKAVTAPQHFELRLPFACDSSKAPWKDLPCEIGITREYRNSPALGVC